MPFSWGLPDLGIEPGSPALWAVSLSSEPPGKPHLLHSGVLRLNAKNLIGSPLVQGPDVLFLSVCLLLSFSQPVVSDSLWPHEDSTPALPIPHYLPKSLPRFMSIASVMPSSHLILWRPLFLLPSIFPSIGDFSNGMAVCIRWPKYRSFSFSISISPFNEHSGLISLKTDWFDLLA